MEDICTLAYRKDFEGVKDLLENGADIESKDKGGRTPLLNSVSGQDIGYELPKFLIKSGADVNVQDSGGFTALHFSAQEKRYDIAKLLLKAGAKLELKDSYGNAPLQRALGNTDAHKRVIELLVSNCADPYNKNDSDISVMDFVLRLPSHPNHDYFKVIHESKS